MQVTDFLNSANVNTGSQTNSKDLGKNEFLKLLVAQLQFQDPLKPLEDKEFIAQLAQFNSLEQMINLNSSFSDLLKLQQLTSASSLIGKNVSGINTDTGTPFTGVVQSVQMNGGDVKVMLAQGEVKLSDITSIS